MENRPAILIAALVASVISLAVAGGIVFALSRRGDVSPAPVAVTARPRAVAVAVATPTPPSAQDKMRTLSAFYEHVTAKEYPAAYALLSPALHREQPYAQFLTRYANVARMDVVESADVPGTRALRVKIVATPVDGEPVTYDGAIGFAFDDARGLWLIDDRSGLKATSVARAGPTDAAVRASGSNGGPAAAATAGAASAANCYSATIVSVSGGTVTLPDNDVFTVEGADVSRIAGWTSGDRIAVCAADTAFALTARDVTVHASSGAAPQ